MSPDRATHRATLKYITPLDVAPADDLEHIADYLFEKIPKNRATDTRNLRHSIRAEDRTRGKEARDGGRVIPYYFIAWSTAVNC
jgi:hypothetical protein